VLESFAMLLPELLIFYAFSLGELEIDFS